MRSVSIIILFALSIHFGYSQSNLLDKYRQMATEYNHDLKAAQKNISASMELIKSAKDDKKPNLDGAANFAYTGNPMELSLNLPMLDVPMSFQGQNMQYGVGLSILQPIYTGGRILSAIKLAEHQSALSENTFNMVRSNVCFQTDVQYWSAVSSVELQGIVESSYRSMEHLKNVVKERVDAGVADPQDLLMVEVKLNNSQYQVLKSQSEVATNRMALNSLIGNDLEFSTELDTQIPMTVDKAVLSANDLQERPEIIMANDRIAIQQSLLKINDSKYKPQFYAGVEGSYSSPGYNFNQDLDLNYAVYAKLAVPIFDWGKRRSDKQANQYKVDMAHDELNKVKDNISLEVQKSRMNLTQSMQRVELTANSLEKAQENELKAIERYNEGKASVVDVIDAQVYRLTTQMNHVQAKFAMQVSYSELLKAINAYNPR